MKQLGYTTIHSYNYGDENGLFSPAATFGHRLAIDKNGNAQHYFVIVVRGTDFNSWDVATDLSAFYDTFHTASTLKVAQFRKFVNEDCGLDLGAIRNISKFFITGHSLGGAVANIFAHNWNNDMIGYKKENIFAYTFASPMTAKTVTALIGDENIYNLINDKGGDPVPWLPPFWKLLPLSSLVFPTFRYGRKIPFSFTVDSDIYRSSFKHLTGTEYADFSAKVALLKPHYVQSYMAELLNRDSKIMEIFKGVLIGIACPVDVDIYDSDDRMLGSIKDDVITNEKAEKVSICVEDNIKYIYFENDEEYTIKLTGTDSGTMEYTIQSLDLSNCEIISEKVFKNVELFDGKRMVSYINVKNETESGTDIPQIPLYVLDNDGNPEKEVLPDNNGTEIPLIHTVTLDANGGTVSPSALKTDYTGKLNNLPAPSRTGYSFNGWYAEVNGGTQVNTDTVFDKDTTIYARWSYNSNSSSGSSSSSSGGYYSGGGYYGGNSNNYVSYYNITFDANGGIVDTATLKTGTNGKLSNLPVPNRSDYKFDGWYTAIAGGTLITTDTIFNKNTTVYAHWTHIEESNQPTVPDTGNESKVPDPIPGTPSVATYKKGDKVTDTDSQAIYKITRVAYSTGIGGTVSYISSTDKKAARIIVPATISLDGVAYKVTKICQSAFKNNLNLKNIVIGKNVETIGNSAFYGCKNLQKAAIGGKVQKLWSKVFYKCKNLTKIVIPVRVTTIGKQAFYGCVKLKSITIKTAKLTSRSVGDNAFKGIASKVFVKVPNKVLKKYKKLLPVKGVSIKARIK